MVDQVELRWQPIETAPRDGTDLLVFVKETGEQFAAYYDTGSWVYAIMPKALGGGKLCCDATDWQPLPDAPQQREGPAYEYGVTWGPRTPTTPERSDG